MYSMVQKLDTNSRKINKLLQNYSAYAYHNNYCSQFNKY